jgi:RNA polymerase sigma-70 factor (ECF subfamily)
MFSLQDNLKNHKNPCPAKNSFIFPPHNRLIKRMEETTLITAARQGDKAAITELLLAHRDLVAGVVNRMVYNREIRIDVIQTIFLKAVSGIKAFNGNCKFSTWLYRLSLNESTEQNRKSLRWDRVTEALDADRPLFPASDVPDGLEALTHKEIASAVTIALNDISLDKKTAFLLFYIGGYSGKDAAAQMKISEQNFFMKLKAARDRVRKSLIDQGWTHE